LNFQGLQPFLGMKLPYYEDFVRVFYTNHMFTAIDDLFIDIFSNQFEIREMDWTDLTNLRYDCIKLTSGTISEEVNFDRTLTLSSMIPYKVKMSEMHVV